MSEYTYLVSPDFDPTVIPEGYIWDETAFQELIKATDKAVSGQTIYTYGGVQGDADAIYGNAADLTISNQKYDSGEVVDTTITANTFNNIGTVTTNGAVVFSVQIVSNFGEFNLDKAASLNAAVVVKNTAMGTINLNAGSTLEGTKIGNAGTITVVSDHAAINGTITNNGTIDALMKKLIVAGDVQNANEDDTAMARNKSVIKAREFEVTGNVLNYGIIGIEDKPIHTMSVTGGALSNYHQLIADILTADSISNDGIYPEIKEKITRGYIDAGEVNAGSIDNVSGTIKTHVSKEGAVGVNVTGTINNGNADNVYAVIEAEINGWIQAGSLNNIGTDVENSLIHTGKLTVGDIVNNGGISARIVESTGTITNNATGLFFITYIDDPIVTQMHEAASLTAGTIVNSGTFTVCSEADLPTPVTVTSIENNGTFEFTGAGFTLTGDIVNNADGQIDVAGTVTGTAATITNSGMITIDGSLAVGAISGGGTVQITVKPADPIAVTADVSGNVIDLEVTLASLTESSYQFVSGTIGGDVTFQVNGTVYEEGTVIGDTGYILTTKGGTGLWMSVKTPGDLNGDGRADVVMTIDKEGLSGDGATGAWLIQKDQTAVWGDLSQRNDGWEIFGKGFTAAGKTTADVYLKSTDNVVGAWTTDAGGAVDGWVTVEEFDSNTRVLGLGDFNGDGQTDLLLRNINGTVGCYLTDGTGWQYIQNLDDGWQISAIGDLNGDGRDDMVLKHDAGFTGSWLTQADFSVEWANLDTLPDGFSIVGTGDFDGDGTDDVLLKNGNYYGAWLVQNGDAVGWFGLGELGEVSVEEIADFNGDGSDDLRIRTAAGDLGSLLVMGADTLDWKYYGSVGEEWNTSLAALS